MKKAIYSILLLSLFACTKKNETACEDWEVKDYCIPKQQTTVCGQPSYSTKTICGAELEDAKAGRETTRHEDASAKSMRKYIKKA